MTKLTIEHNGNIYSWIGEKWGNVKIEKFFISHTVYVQRKGLPAIHTYHTLDQLVKLGYMELQPQEEKCNHVSDGMVYTSNPPKYKCKKCGYMTTEYMSQKEKTEESPSGHQETVILTKLRARFELELERHKNRNENMTFTYLFVQDLLEKFLSLLNELETQPPAPEELKPLPDFDWLKLCRKSEESGGEGFLWSAVGYQLEAITKYIKTERVNLISKSK